MRQGGRTGTLRRWADGHAAEVASEENPDQREEPAVGSKKNISPSTFSLTGAGAARPLPAPGVRSGPEKLPEVPRSVRLASQQGLRLAPGRCQEPHRRCGRRPEMRYFLRLDSVLQPAITMLPRTVRNPGKFFA